MLAKQFFVKYLSCFDFKKILYSKIVMTVPLTNTLSKWTGFHFAINFIITPQSMVILELENS